MIEVSKDDQFKICDHLDRLVALGATDAKGVFPEKSGDLLGVYFTWQGKPLEMSVVIEKQEQVAWALAPILAELARWTLQETASAA